MPTRTSAPPGDAPTLTQPTGPDPASTIDAPARAGPPDVTPVIPRYVVGRRLGYGGMGVVYEAVAPVGVKVALKVIHPDYLTPALRVRFLQEARAMMGLDHPHLARIYDYGEADAGPYFTMRLLSGRTLADLLPAPDPAAGLRTLLKAADAVSYLHARRLVHRDLKPSNVLLGDGDEPFVSDFGLIKELAGGSDPTDGLSPAGATSARGGSPTLTQTGRAIGTRAYMAPEQRTGDHARVGPPADVYALGLIASEIAWGARPAVGPDGSVALPGGGTASSLPTGVKVLLPFVLPESGPADAAPPAPRAALPAAVEAGVRRVIATALAPDPGARYPDAGAFHAALTAALAPVPAPPPAAEPRPTRRRVLAAVGAVGAVGLGAMLWPRRKEEPPPTEEPLAALQREFADADSIELLREDGTWRWSEFLGGECEWNPGPPAGGPADARGWFAPPADGIRLLEVARGLPQGFRFVVEAAALGTRGAVGVYVGQSVQPVAGRPNHCFVGLKVEAGAGGRPVRSVVGLMCPAAAPTDFTTAADRPSPAWPAAAGPWTAVALELTATDLVVRAAGQPFVEYTRNQLLRLSQRHGVRMPKNAAVTPTYQPAEGLGVFAERDSIAVRSARLERA